MNRAAQAPIEDPEAYQRLLGKCRAHPDTGCWEWLGGMGSKNKATPMFHFPEQGRQRRTMAAYKAVWLLSGKRVPAGQLVYRTCPNQKCVNPGHCKTGTSRDMWAHIVKSGRHKGNPARTLHSTRNVNRRRTPASIVRQIEALLAAGAKRVHIASQLGVDKKVVTDVKHGRHFHCATRPKLVRGASVFAL